MSRVTGVMLICGIGEEPVAEISRWLADRHGGWRINEISDHAGGGKHPQFDAWCGGFNYFDDAQCEFTEFAMGLRWEYPENVVLVVQPEEGATAVFRPACSVRLTNSLGRAASNESDPTPEAGNRG